MHEIIKKKKKKMECSHNNDDADVLDRAQWISISAHIQWGRHVVVPAGNVLPPCRSGRLDGGVLHLPLHHGGGAETRGSFCAVHQVFLMLNNNLLNLLICLRNKPDFYKPAFVWCYSDTGTMAPERCVFGIMMDVSAFLGNTHTHGSIL